MGRRSAEHLSSRSQIFASTTKAQQTPSHARGFSLLEVIAAIMLLALAFGALMQVAGGSIRLSQKASDYTQAALWARSKLDSSFVLEPLQPGMTQGNFDNRFSWRMQVTPWAVPDTAPPGTPYAFRMYKLDLDVIWGSAPFEHTARFSTLRVSGGTGS
ncbi:type IV pilus modification PilV family protein [Dyella acidisoli]|uniref:General secretion pathway protein GspI n=1 Tax=Dyella acidisoli TaxID=1867834 RepID=A0ABQ5XU92_9GAMM|nr:type II secretion system protein [Dyella acidisoli]GLQ93889.1 general secretion pathway protein GspI [Dyella acidisoli]